MTLVTVFLVIKGVKFGYTQIGRHVQAKYYLKHEHKCFIRYKTRGAAERFISDKGIL